MPEAADALFMARCHQLAAEAAAHGESPVGALVVRAGAVVAAAAEATRRQADVTAHAELRALQQARQQLGSADLSDCTLYSTHEPCVMCAYVIRYHRIGRVVYGQASAYLGGVSSAFALLTTQEVPPHWTAPPLVEQWLTQA
ncbi:nucleoside deaminase [Hymenobacter jeollabukensis]|uniref:Nucleoside deaminase n=1 Tax=Hymenobacter jeollabukensis TaxID=2025313 RepID=A0A5R8WKT6_9BACT|nr:deaminase [Hymenobacter jeollabukensis]TLM89195.1 nucleoside deaminase [Hymenobacter jeollabukensis]